MPAQVATAYGLHGSLLSACALPFFFNLPTRYPSAMWRLDGLRGAEIIFAYSVNKEDIAISRFPLDAL